MAWILGNVSVLEKFPRGPSMGPWLLGRDLKYLDDQLTQ